MGKLTNILNAPATATGKSLLEICDQYNRHRLAERIGCWHYVVDANGAEHITKIEGTEGDNIHKLMRGELVDFQGWSEARMTGYRNWLEKLISAGLVNAGR